MDCTRFASSCCEMLPHSSTKAPASSRKILEGIGPSSHPPIQQVPEVLNGIEIWALRWPWQNADIPVLQEISHTARSVRDFPQDRNVSVLPWPVKSLDLSPIEHVWDLLDLRLSVRARPIPPRNFRELAGALVEEWGNISQQELANLVQSMRRRSTAVLNAAGGNTRY